MRRALSFVVAVVLFVGCAERHRRASSTTVQPADTVVALRQRPLRLPSVQSSDACPVSTSWSEPARNLGGMLGDGPARPVIGRDAVLSYTVPAADNAFAGSDWGGNKVLWAVAPGIDTPVLVRGRELNGSGEVRFGLALLPERELVLPAPKPGEHAPAGYWRDFPAMTRLQHAGCYGYQVDTRSTSLTIVFEAR